MTKKILKNILSLTMVFSMLSQIVTPVMAERWYVGLAEPSFDSPYIQLYDYDTGALMSDSVFPRYGYINGRISYLENGEQRFTSDSIRFDQLKEFEFFTRHIYKLTDSSVIDKHNTINGIVHENTEESKLELNNILDYIISHERNNTINYLVYSVLLDNGDEEIFDFNLETKDIKRLLENGRISGKDYNIITRDNPHHQDIEVSKELIPTAINIYKKTKYDELPEASKRNILNKYFNNDEHQQYSNEANKYNHKLGNGNLTTKNDLTQLAKFDTSNLSGKELTQLDSSFNNTNRAFPIDGLAHNDIQLLKYGYPSGITRLAEDKQWKNKSTPGWFPITNPIYPDNVVWEGNIPAGYTNNIKGPFMRVTSLNMTTKFKDTDLEGNEIYSSMRIGPVEDIVNAKLYEKNNSPYLNSGLTIYPKNTDLWNWDEDNAVIKLKNKKQDNIIIKIDEEKDKLQGAHFKLFRRDVDNLNQEIQDGRTYAGFFYSVKGLPDPTQENILVANDNSISKMMYTRQHRLPGLSKAYSNVLGENFFKDIQDSIDYNYFKDNDKITLSHTINYFDTGTPNSSYSKNFNRDTSLPSSWLYNDRPSVDNTISVMHPWEQGNEVNWHNDTVLNYTYNKPNYKDSSLVDLFGEDTMLEAYRKAIETHKIQRIVFDSVDEVKLDNGFNYIKINVRIEPTDIEIDDSKLPIDELKGHTTSIEELYNTIDLIQNGQKNSYTFNLDFLNKYPTFEKYIADNNIPQTLDGGYDSTLYTIVKKKYDSLEEFKREVQPLVGTKITKGSYKVRIDRTALIDESLNPQNINKEIIKYLDLHRAPLELISNATGEVKLPFLEDGYYYLKEVKAPDKNGIKSYNFDPDKEYDFIVLQGQAQRFKNSNIVEEDNELRIYNEVSEYDIVPYTGPIKKLIVYKGDTVNYKSALEVNFGDKNNSLSVPAPISTATPTKDYVNVPALLTMGKRRYSLDIPVLVKNKEPWHNVDNLPSVKVINDNYVYEYKESPKDVNYFLEYKPEDVKSVETITGFDTNTPGKKEAKVKVLFNKGGSKTLTIHYKVNIDYSVDIKKPVYEREDVVGESYKSYITGPNITGINLVEGQKIDTSTLGNRTVKVNVTYSDGAVKEKSLPYEVIDWSKYPGVTKKIVVYKGDPIDYNSAFDEDFSDPKNELKLINPPTPSTARLGNQIVQGVLKLGNKRYYVRITLIVKDKTPMVNINEQPELIVLANPFIFEYKETPKEMKNYVQYNEADIKSIDPIVNFDTSTPGTKEAKFRFNFSKGGSKVVKINYKVNKDHTVKMEIPEYYQGDEVGDKYKSSITGSNLQDVSLPRNSFIYTEDLGLRNTKVTLIFNDGYTREDTFVYKVIKRPRYNGRTSWINIFKGDPIDYTLAFPEEDFSNPKNTVEPIVEASNMTVGNQSGIVKLTIGDMWYIVGVIVTVKDRTPMTNINQLPNVKTHEQNFFTQQSDADIMTLYEVDHNIVESYEVKVSLDLTTEGHKTAKVLFHFKGGGSKVVRARYNVIQLPDFRINFRAIEPLTITSSEYNSPIIPVEQPTEVKPIEPIIEEVKNDKPDAEEVYEPEHIKITDVDEHAIPNKHIHKKIKKHNNNNIIYALAKKVNRVYKDLPKTGEQEFNPLILSPIPILLLCVIFIILRKKQK